MEEARKLSALARSADRENSRPSSPASVAAETPSTENRTQDRWFLEQRGGKKVPKLLEIPNEVSVTSAGPLRMKGNIILIDEDGTESHHNDVQLCRCGASRSGPLCDGQHVNIEFFDNGAITEASNTIPLNRPGTLKVTCVKDGPLKFTGVLRVKNRRGQECHSRGGVLCRCGRSSKKPFCDCL